MLLEVDRVSQVFESKDGRVPALDEVSLHVAAGEFVCLVGPSGCGKTTLLRIVAGLVEPSAGEIRFADGRAGAGRVLVFQEHGLFPWMTVLDNIAFGLEARGVPRDERRERARAFAERVGLAAFADRYPHHLSVGMRQRVALARAFVLDPALLLLDEPFGALDAQTALVMHEELVERWRQVGAGVLYVTHNIQDALALADRVVVLSGRPGRVLDTIVMPCPRERRGEALAQLEEIKWHIWRRLESEVRASLGVRQRPGDAPPAAGSSGS